MGWLPFQSDTWPILVATSFLRSASVLQCKSIRYIWWMSLYREIFSTTYHMGSIPVVCTLHWHLCCPRSHHRWCPKCHWYIPPLDHKALSHLHPVKCKIGSTHISLCIRQKKSYFLFLGRKNKMTLWCTLAASNKNSLHLLGGSGC